MKSDSPRIPSSNKRNCLLNPYNNWHIAKCPSYVFTKCCEVGMVGYLNFLETCPKTHKVCVSKMDGVRPDGHLLASWYLLRLALRGVRAGTAPKSGRREGSRSASRSVAAAHLQQDSEGAGDSKDRPRSVRGTVGRWGERGENPKTPNAPCNPVLHFGACRDLGLDRQGKWGVGGAGGG